MRFRDVRTPLFVFLIGLCLFAAASADIKIPPAPSRWATDTAGFLSPETVTQLDSQLEAFERETGHQVLLYVGESTGGYPIEEFAVKAFEAWKVGRKGLDDGLVLFIMARDHKIRIEVGYGLEPVVTDLKSAEVINSILVPGIQSGNPDRAVRSAISSLLGTISGKAVEAPSGGQAPVTGQRPAARPQVSLFDTILVIVLIVGFLILLITHPSLALWLLFNILSGGRGGGGGGGGGGFGGGGGRSGGGGASGSW